LRGRVCAFAAEFRDLFGQFVAVGLQGLNLRDGLTPFAVHCGKVTQRGGGVYSPGAQFFFN